MELGAHWRRELGMRWGCRDALLQSKREFPKVNKDAVHQISKYEDTFHDLMISACVCAEDNNENMRTAQKSLKCSWDEAVPKEVAIDQRWDRGSRYRDRDRSCGAAVRTSDKQREKREVVKGQRSKVLSGHQNLP